MPNYYGPTRTTKKTCPNTYITCMDQPEAIVRDVCASLLVGGRFGGVGRRPIACALDSPKREGKGSLFVAQANWFGAHGEKQSQQWHCSTQNSLKRKMDCKPSEQIFSGHTIWVKSVNTFTHVYNRPINFMGERLSLFRSAYGLQSGVPFSKAFLNYCTSSERNCVNRVLWEIG